MAVVIVMKIEVTNTERANDGEALVAN